MDPLQALICVIIAQVHKDGPALIFRCEIRVFWRNAVKTSVIKLHKWLEGAAAATSFLCVDEQKTGKREGLPRTVTAWERWCSHSTGVVTLLNRDVGTALSYPSSPRELQKNLNPGAPPPGMGYSASSPETFPCEFPGRCGSVGASLTGSWALGLCVWVCVCVWSLASLGLGSPLTVQMKRCHLCISSTNAYWAPITRP